MEDGVWLTRDEAWEVLFVLLQVIERDPSDARAYAIWRTVGQRLAPELFPE